MKCHSFLSWWWWEYCMRSLKNTCSFFGSTYIKSFRQVICSRNLKVGQCLGNTFFVTWMPGPAGAFRVWNELKEVGRSRRTRRDLLTASVRLWLYWCNSLSLGITNCHLVLQILCSDLQWLYLAARDDGFLRKSWVYVCGGQYCSSPTIVTVWSTSGKTVSLLSHLDNFHLSAALTDVVFVRAVALYADITARVWFLHVACLSRKLVACHSLCSCSTSRLTLKDFGSRIFNYYSDMILVAVLSLPLVILV